MRRALCRMLFLFDESHYAPSHRTIGSVEPLFWLDGVPALVLFRCYGCGGRRGAACAYPCAWNARHTLCPNTARPAAPVQSETGPRVWPAATASSARTPQCTADAPELRPPTEQWPAARQSRAVRCAPNPTPYR